MSLLWLLVLNFMVCTMSSSSFGTFVYFLAPRVTSYVHCSKWLQYFWFSNTWHLNLQRLLCLSASSSRFLHLSHLFSPLLHKAGESHSVLQTLARSFPTDFVPRIQTSWLHHLCSRTLSAGSASRSRLSSSYPLWMHQPWVFAGFQWFSFHVWRDPAFSYLEGLSFLLGLPLLFYDLANLNLSNRGLFPERSTCHLSPWRWNTWGACQAKLRQWKGIS